MTDAVAADCHSRPAPQCRSCTISCRYMLQNLATLIHVAMVASFFSSMVKEVEQLVLGLTSQEVARMSARVALATEFGIRYNIPNTDGIRYIFFLVLGILCSTLENMLLIDCGCGVADVVLRRGVIGRVLGR